MSEHGRRILKRAEVEHGQCDISRIGATDDDPQPDSTVETASTVEPLDAGRDPDEVDRTKRLVQAILSGFARQRRELLGELQPHVVRIAVEVARRIVQRELRTDPGMVTRTVRSALEQVAVASTTRVRVNPLDAQVLQTTIREIVPAPDEAAALEIIPDGSIERGGCVVESDRGIVDARLRTQFDEVQARLLDGLSTTRSAADNGRHEGAT